MLQTVGEGMYGSSGHLNKMLNIGKSSVGFSITGGQTHMGSLYDDDLIIFNGKNLTKAGTITIGYSYGDLENVMDENRFCYEINYSFVLSDKDVYDIFLPKAIVYPMEKVKY